MPVLEGVYFSLQDASSTKIPADSVNVDPYNCAVTQLWPVVSNIMSTANHTMIPFLIFDLEQGNGLSLFARLNESPLDLAVMIYSFLTSPLCDPHNAENLQIISLTLNNVKVQLDILLPILSS